jgi:hypothetical protein
MKKRIPIAAGLIVALVLSYFAINAVNERLALTRTFNRIYTDGIWGTDLTGKGTSGSGSTLEITREYRAFVEQFVKTHAVKSQDVEPGGYRAIDLAAPPFAVRGLVDLPIKFGDATTKITSLLDLTLHR